MWQPPPKMPKNLAEQALGTSAAYPLFAWLCYSRQVTNIIDIGIYRGATTWMLAQCIQKPGKLVSVDIDPRSFKNITLRIKQIEDLDWIPIHGDSGAQNFRKLFGGPVVQLAWIDGGHTKEQIEKDIAVVVPAMSKHSFMIFHDYQPDKCPGIKATVDALKGWEILRSRSIPDKNGFAIARRQI